MCAFDTVYVVPGPMCESSGSPSDVISSALSAMPTTWVWSSSFGCAALSRIEGMVTCLYLTISPSASVQWRWIHDAVCITVWYRMFEAPQTPAYRFISLYLYLVPELHF